MKIYVIAGEASGDLHGSNLMAAMLAEDSAIEFRFWGGDRMEALAGKPVKHIKELAFMGFIEVVANLKTILGNIKFCKQDILSFKPDAIVLIDYPGFNLRIAEWAHQQGIKVIYYISPQVWAWKQKRVHKIKKVVGEMYVILPFEKDFYNKFDMDVHYVGHPLLDEIKNFREKQLDFASFTSRYKLDSKPIIALLPGSRKQEISIKLPIMLSVVKDFPDYQFVIAVAPSQDVSFYEQFINDDSVHLVEGANYQLLANSHAALVTSGTATLETALFKVPQVVCYKGSSISYQIAKRLIKVKYISLVNLIVDKEVVKELIQNELNTVNLRHELGLILESKTRDKLAKEYSDLIETLGGSGASEIAAKSMLKTIKP